MTITDEELAELRKLCEETESCAMSDCTFAEWKLITAVPKLLDALDSKDEEIERLKAFRTDPVVQDFRSMV